MMRKSVLASVGLAGALGLGGTLFALSHTGDPLAAGKRQMAEGDERAATLYFREAVRKQPGNPEAAFLLGKTDLGLGKAAAAELELRRARARGWPEAAVLYPLGQAYLAQHQAQALLKDFDPDQAPAALRPEVLALRAAAELMLKHRDAADDLAAQAEAAAPRDPRVLIIGARSALFQGDEATAARRAEGALNGEPPPDKTIREDALLLQGELAMRHADTAAALGKARQVTSEAPLRLDAKLLEARALASGGQVRDARREVEAVLERSPADVAANYLLAVLAIHDADYAAANAALLRAGPSVSDLPRGLYFLAVTKLGVQQLPQAEDAARQFLAAAPDDVSGQKLMAEVDLAQSRPQAALLLLRGKVLSAREDADTLDLRGRAFGMLGDVSGARDAFAKAAALHPGDANLLNRLAAAELDLGHVAKGEADLKHSLELAPKQLAAGTALIESDLARGDVDSARADLAHMDASKRQTDAGAVLAADIARADLDPDGAERLLRAARARFPDSRAVVLSLYQLEKARGEDAAARAMLQVAQAAHPADFGLLAMALQEFYASRDTAAAVKAAQMAHDAASADPRIAAALAVAYAHAGQTDRAIGLLDRESAGTDPALDLLRARLLAQAGKRDQAVDALRLLLDRAPSNTGACAMLVSLLVKSGDFAGARTAVMQGLAAVPGDAALLKAAINVDFAEAGSAKRGEAAALVTAARLQANPANLPEAAMLPGLVHLAAGDVQGAAAALASAFIKSPSSGLAIAAATQAAAAGRSADGAALLGRWTMAHPGDTAALLVLSSLQLESGEDAKAAATLGAVLAREPANAAALNNLACLKQREGDLATAAQLAKRAYFQAPWPDMADTLGWILQKQGQTQAALPFLKQAATSGNASLHAAASYHFAVALAASGNKAAARSAVQAALAQHVSFHDQDAAEKFAMGLQ